MTWISLKRPRLFLGTVVAVVLSVGMMFGDPVAGGLAFVGVFFLILAVIVLSIMELWTDRSRSSLTTLGAWVLLLLAWLPSLRMAGKLNWHFKRQEMVRIAANLQPAIDAIRKYENETGEPPTSLEKLVPKYLASTPSTGSREYPDLHYVRDSIVHPVGAPWKLRIPTGAGLNFDRFEYLPTETYPENASGGSYERIGRWGYFHE